MTGRLGCGGWSVWSVWAVAVVLTAAGLGWIAESGPVVTGGGALMTPPTVPDRAGEPLGVRRVELLDAAEVFIQGGTVLTLDDVVSQLTTECRTNDTDPAMAAATFAPGLPPVNPEEEFVEEQLIHVTVRVMTPSGEVRTTQAVSYRATRVTGPGANYLQLTVTTDEGPPTIGSLTLFRHDGADWRWGGGSLPSAQVYLGDFGQSRSLICGQPTDLPPAEPESTVPRTE